MLFVVFFFLEKEMVNFIVKPSSQYATYGHEVRRATFASCMRYIVNICRWSTRAHHADALRHHVDRIDFYPRISTSLYAHNAHDVDHG